jgi:hypothetical protein
VHVVVVPTRYLPAVHLNGATVRVNEKLDVNLDRREKRENRVNEKLDVNTDRRRHGVCGW